MKSIITRTNGLLILVLLLAVIAWRIGTTQPSGARTGIAPQTSINALMVALVDHAAHEIWDAGAADTLTGREWQTVEQHAIQLAAAGTLISLGGTGVADTGWAMAPAWQQWSQRLTDAGLAALAAWEDVDQEALNDAGNDLVDTCEGCHETFKPESPTEGLLHIPHYD